MAVGGLSTLKDVCALGQGVTSYEDIHVSIWRGSMRYLDMETWPRREHFKLFNAYEHPHFGITANVDLTAFYPVAK